MTIYFSKFVNILNEFKKIILLTAGWTQKYGRSRAPAGAAVPAGRGCAQRLS